MEGRGLRSGWGTGVRPASRGCWRPKRGEWFYAWQTTRRRQFKGGEERECSLLMGCLNSVADQVDIVLVFRGDSQNLLCGGYERSKVTSNVLLGGCWTFSVRYGREVTHGSVLLCQESSSNGWLCKIQRGKARGDARSVVLWFLLLVGWL